MPDSRACEKRQFVGKRNVRTGGIPDYAGHLKNFSLFATNPSYGIWWQVADRGLGFNAECYGGSIESQAATIEICTNALSWSGLLVAIIPTTTFSNAKDSRLREHLYTNYTMLLRATLHRLFKEEYGIDVSVELVVAQENYRYGEGQRCKHLELDLTKDLNRIRGVGRFVKCQDMTLSAPSDVPIFLLE